MGGSLVCVVVFGFLGPRLVPVLGSAVRGHSSDFSAGIAVEEIFTFVGELVRLLRSFVPERDANMQT